jgi:hypothetical protein
LVTALANISVAAFPALARKDMSVELHSVATRATERDAFAFRCAALAEVGICAICIIAMNVLCIMPMNEASRAIERSTDTLWHRTSLQVLDRATGICAHDVHCLLFQDMSLGSIVRVATCNVIAACVPVFVRARPLRTRDQMIVRFGNKILGAMVGVTLAFCTTALVEICICAIRIIARYVFGIVSKQESWRAGIHGTFAFFGCACGKVFFNRARRILALNVCRILSQDMSFGNYQIVATSHWNTACIAISIVA